MTINSFLALDRNEQHGLLSGKGDMVMEFIQGVRTIKIYKINEFLVKVKTTTVNDEWIVEPYSGQETFSQFDLIH